MSNRDRPLRSGYHDIPNALWTLEGLTPKQTLLLGWLHSHADNYLERLSLNRIGAEFGGGRKSATTGCKALEELGYLTLVTQANGHQSYVILLSQPWEDLKALSMRGNSNLPHFDTGGCSDLIQGGVSKSHRGVYQNEAPKYNHTETPTKQDQVNLFRAAELAPAVAQDERFELFWSTYGRTGSKKDARKAWDKAVTKDSAENIQAGLEKWVSYWETPGAASKKWPQGFLNSEYWLSDPPTARSPNASRAGQTIDNLKLQMEKKRNDARQRSIGPSQTFGIGDGQQS